MLHEYYTKSVLKMVFDLNVVVREPEPFNLIESGD